MDHQTQSQVIILYHPNSVTQEQVVSAISKDLKIPVTPYSLVFKQKDHGVLIFIELAKDIVQKLLQIKTVAIETVACFVKRFYCDHQIFINKLPLTIDQADVKEYFSQFGEVSNVQIMTVKHTFENGKTADFRHCYIMFRNSQAANKVILAPNRHLLKKEELKIHRTYGIAQGDDTDKKFFLRVMPKADKPEELQNLIQQKIVEVGGQFREKMKLEDSNDKNISTIVLTSAKSGELVYEKLKEFNIGNYRITLRPHASELALFAPGLKANVNEEVVKKAFSRFGRVTACNLAQKNNGMGFVQNATINFQEEEDAKKALIQYEGVPEVLSLYAAKPYLTIHMSLKERKEFNNFNQKNKHIVRNPPPMGFNNGPFPMKGPQMQGNPRMPPPQNFQQYPPPSMGMNPPPAMGMNPRFQQHQQQQQERTM